MIYVRMKSGSVWQFSNIAGAYVCRQRKHLYCLFLEPEPWIGRWDAACPTWWGCNEVIRVDRILWAGDKQ